MYETRAFNQVTARPDEGVVVKTSTNIPVLSAEYGWYKGVPSEVKAFTPEVYSFRNTGDTATIEMEMVQGRPLASEYIKASPSDAPMWLGVLNDLLEVVSVLKKNAQQHDGVCAIQELCFQKTAARVISLRYQYNNKRLVDGKNVIVNGKELANASTVLLKSIEYIESMQRRRVDSVMHGDLCFSNIIMNEIGKRRYTLLDPRGYVNKTRTVYGDARYDVAKLRHSMCGGYDYILNGDYTLEELNDAEYNFSYKEPSVNGQLFDETVEIFGYDPVEIQFIEGCLFCSMPPLHYEDNKRQKALYINGLTILNAALQRAGVL